MIEMKFTALITIVALVFTFVLSGRVGGLRIKTGVAAPAITGHPEFERAFRVHYNTIEQLVLFLPLLWLSTQVVGDVWAAAIGLVWIIGRVLYANTYMKDPDKRGPGMIMTVLATGVLSLVCLWGVVAAFL